MIYYRERKQPLREEIIKMARTKAVSEDIEKLIKRANQRLRQLEKDELANQSKAYQYIMKKASKNLASDTKVKMFSYTRSGEIKFRTDLAKLMKENKNVYKALIRTATGFTESKSSTKLGMEDAIKQSYNTYKEKTGFKGSYTEWADRWSNDEYQYLVKVYGVSSADELISITADNFSFSFDKALHEVYEATNNGRLSKEGIFEFIKEKYDLKNEDYEEVNE